MVELDDEFDFATHVTVVDLKNPDDDRELQALVAGHRTEMLERDRPLWQAIWVNRYRDGSAVILRTHHAIADGMRMVELAMSLFDATPEGHHPAQGSFLAQNDRAFARPIAARATASRYRGQRRRAPYYGRRISGRGDAMSVGSFDNGKTVELQRGESMTIRLPENPTTGYRWAVESIDQERLEIVQDRFVQDARDVGDPDAADKLATREDPFAPGAAGAVGAGGYREFVVKGAQAGMSFVRLRLGQPWDRESSAAERFELRVSVRA